MTRVCGLERVRRSTGCKAALVLCLAAFVTGCGVAGIGSGKSLDPALVETLEIYQARASLLETEFEQFKVVGQQVFVECGKIKRGRPRPQLQTLIELDQAALADVRERAARIYTLIKSSTPKFDPPGKLDHFADSGQFFASIETKDGSVSVRSDFDSIAYAQGPAQSLLARLSQSLRKLVMGQLADKKLCGNVTFYGLGEAR